MKYTKEQRRDIYLKAAEEILLSPYKEYCCIIIKKIIWQDIQKWHMDKELALVFPEIYLFKSKAHKNGGGWWSNEDKEARLIALLLCIEMCS